MEIGEQITAKRIEKGMTQRQLAEKLNKDKSNISRIERGDGSHQIKTIQETVNALDCDLEMKIVDRNEGIIAKTMKYLQGMNLVLSIEYNADEIRKQASEALDEHEIDLSSMIGIPSHAGITETIVQNQFLNKLLSMDTITENSVLCIDVGKEWSRLVANSLLLITCFEDECDEYGIKVDFHTGKLITNIDSKGERKKAIFNEFFYTVSNQKEMLKRIIDENNKKLELANSFIEAHPEGFPFTCYLDREENSTSSSIKFDYEPCTVNILRDSETIYAWDEEDAIDDYLENFDEDILDWYCKCHLVDDLIDCLYFGEMDYDIFLRADSVKSQLDEIYEQIDHEDEEEYRSKAKTILSRNKVLDILGYDNVKRFFKYANKDYVTSLLDEKSFSLYEFIGDTMKTA